MISHEIANLDLTAVKNKIMHSSGESWSLEKATQAEVEYKEFLHLCQKHPNMLIGLTLLADKLWHYHILDTVKYVDDCNRLFGSYMHHNPNMIEEESKIHGEAINNFRQLYEIEFGQAANEEITELAMSARAPEMAMSARVQQEMAMSARTPEMALSARVQQEMALSARVQQEMALSARVQEEMALSARVQQEMALSARVQQEMALSARVQQEMALSARVQEEMALSARAA